MLLDILWGLVLGILRGALFESRGWCLKSRGMIVWDPLGAYIKTKNKDGETIRQVEDNGCISLRLKNATEITCQHYF